jgi:hypothetical protein
MNIPPYQFFVEITHNKVVRHWVKDENMNGGKMWRKQLCTMQSLETDEYKNILQQRSLY